MIKHVCIAVSSEDTADVVFEKIFHLKRLYSFTVAADVMRALFRVNGPATARVYDAGNTNLEVFITPEAKVFSAGFHHICVEVPHRDRFILNALDAGFRTRRYDRPDGSAVVFIEDTDGNLYEIKEKTEVSE